MFYTHMNEIDQLNFSILNKQMHIIHNIAYLCSKEFDGHGIKLSHKERNIMTALIEVVSSKRKHFSLP